MEDNQEGGSKASKVIARGILGAVYGFRIGILAAALVLLLAWASSPRGMLLGVGILTATIFAGLVSGLAMGTGRGRMAVMRAMLGGLVTSPIFIAVTIIGIPRLFQARTLSGEHKRLVLVILKSVSPVHFVFAALVGLIVGWLIARMKEDVFFVVRLRR
jgi:hypothetical protein